ncbi:MAG: hypothetical protein R6X02_09355 [Enhygromyxa sp.]
MSVDITKTLQGCLDEVTDPTKISISKAKLGSAFGSQIELAIEQIFAGSISIDGATFSFQPGNPPEASAVVKGTGDAAPLLSQIDASASFTAAGEDVTLDFKLSFTSDYPVSNAWSALNEPPFTQLTLSSGSGELVVKPTDKSFDLTISATASYGGNPLTTGLFVASYDGSKLGFLGGFVVDGTWTPSSDIPVLGGLSIKGDAGLFVSQITQTDLSAFEPLNLVYLPDQITPGLTFFAGMELGGKLGPLSSLLPSGTTFDLQAILPPEGLSKASVIAELKEPASQNAFQFKDLKLEWQSTSADSGKISLSVDAEFVDGSNSLEIEGDLTFTYSPNPTGDALEGELNALPGGAWAHPFGIQTLTIKEISFALSLTEEGINAALAGTFELGSVADLTVGAGLLDFEVPSFIDLELSSTSKDKSVTLVDLIDALIPGLLPSNFPFFSNISFKELQLWAADDEIEIEDKQYYPGFGATGEISFFGFDIDGEFVLKTSTSKAPNQPMVVQAKGSISQDGGPILIKIGSLTLLEMFEATDHSKGPSLCVDTSGSGFCKTGDAPADSYFVIDAGIDLLGLNASVYAYAAKSSIAFDVSLNTGGNNWFSAELACALDPSQATFNAYAQLDFNPPDIQVPSLGVIPSFTIPTPKIDFAIAFGDQVPATWPSNAPFPKPTDADYFILYFDFEFAGLNLSTHFSISISSADLSDPGTFVAQLIGKAVLELLKDAWKDFVKVLVWLGHTVAEIAKWISKELGVLLDDVFEFASEVWDEFTKICAVTTGNDALQSSSSGAADVLLATSSVLADLTHSNQGQQLLYHYYLHRDELRARLMANEPLIEGLRVVLDASASDFGAFRAQAMKALTLVAADASPDFKASVAEVAVLLETNSATTYSGFLEALAD